MGATTSRVPLPDHTIAWYRTPLAPDVSARLHEVSDARGAAQTLGYLCTLLGSGGAAVYYSGRSLPLATLFALLYGLQANFLINAMVGVGE